MRWVGKENSRRFSEVSVWDLSLVQKMWIQGIFLMALFIILYAPVFSFLMETWRRRDDYSHGFLVPLLSLYLIWTKREQLSQIPVAPSFLGGIPLIILAGLMLLLGKLGGVVILQDVSLLVMIFGLFLLLLGRVHVKALALPLAYLIFMIPVFGEGSKGLHWPFQLLAADIGVWLLQLLGFAAFQEAQYIHLPQITLEVVEACSGIKYLISIIAIGIPLAYFTQRTWPRRIGLVGFSMAIAILANGIRVASIGIWVYYRPDIVPAIVHGPYHIFQGMLVAWVGFVALFVGAWFLSRGPTRVKVPTVSLGPVDTGVLRGLVQRSSGDQLSGNDSWNRSWSVAILLLLAIGGFYYFHRVSPIPLQQGLKAIPMVIGGWSGGEADPRKMPFRLRGADEEIMRIYRNNAGEVVSLYIGYFEFQDQSKELVNYYYKDFYRGMMEVELLTEDGFSRKVNQVVLNDRRENRVVLFWYDLNGRLVADHYQVKFFTLWDSLTRGQTNGAMIVVSIPFQQAGDLERALQDEQGFIRELVPILHHYLPDISGEGRHEVGSGANIAAGGR